MSYSATPVSLASLSSASFRSKTPEEQFEIMLDLGLVDMNTSLFYTGECYKKYMPKVFPMPMSLGGIQPMSFGNISPVLAPAPASKAFPMPMSLGGIPL